MSMTELSETAVLAVPVERVWQVVSATDRYAEWVDGVLEVTDHHGQAEVGRTYAEHNRTIGPLTTRSTWTVREIEPLTTRIDTGEGFAPMHEMTNVFRFRPVAVDGVEGAGTEMTYAVRYRVGLGPIGAVIDKVTQPGLRKSFQQSMRNLEDLIVAEGQ
jgi:uncharacterized protein YndB with AHSA1/START domain